MATNPDDLSFFHPCRRKWLRYRTDLPVLVVTACPTKVATLNGRGAELNGGGLAVEVAMDLAVDDQVAVEFTPSYSHTPVSFRCFVRNCNGHRYGLEFITENDADYIKTGELQEALAAMHTDGHGEKIGESRVQEELPGRS